MCASSSKHAVITTDFEELSKNMKARTEKGEAFPMA
jgi:hypothetical protein